MNTNIKALNINELSINELEAVTGGEMTRKEREAALAPDPDDNILQAAARWGLRKVVGGIDAIAVSWGYRPMKDFPGVTVVDSAEELMDQLLTGAPR